MSAHVWHPLGFRRTVRFLFSRHPGAASWRHFGWELSIERTLGSIDFWLHREVKNGHPGARP